MIAAIMIFTIVAVVVGIAMIYVVRSLEHEDE
jgi:hypothetical protein